MNGRSGKKGTEIVNTIYKKGQWTYIKEIGAKKLFTTVGTVKLEYNEKFELFLAAGDHLFSRAIFRICRSQTYSIC